MSTPLRVLIAEDSENDALLLVRELQRGGYEPVFERVMTAEAMASALEEKTWDVIIADYVMPGFDALAALKLVQKRDLDLPIIIVSGAVGEDRAVAAMKAGAHDFVIKDNLARLVPALEREIREARVRRERRLAEEALRESEERYRTFIEAATDIIATIDLDSGVISSVNRFVEETLGYKREQIVNKVSYLDLIHPDDRGEAQRRLEDRIYRDIRHPNSPYRLRKADGLYLDVEINGGLLLDNKGKPATYLAIIRDMTERKRADQALSESEERYRTLVDSSLTGIYVVQDGKIRFANKRFYEMSSYTGEEVKTQPGLDRVHPEDRERVAGAVARLISGEDTAAHYEFRVLSKTGDVRWLESFGVPIEYEGKPAILANMMDITERKTAEQKTIQVKEEWEQTFDTVPDLIAILDNKYGIVRVNRAMADKLGVAPDDAVGVTCYKAVHGTDKPPPFCPHAQLLRDGQEHTTEVYEENMGGDFLVTVTPLHDGEDRLIGSVHVARDITERKRAEEALRESEEKYRNVVENVNVGILVAQDEKLVFANTAISNFLGYAKEELLASQNPFEYIHPDDRPMVLERHLKRIAGEEVAGSYSFRVITKAGLTRWVDVTGVRVNWNNKPATLNFFMDSSERMRAEQDQRTLEARLQDIQKMEAIGKLAGGIAHEFNNALVGITGNIELLQMSMGHVENIDKYAHPMKESARRMVTLTNQLLAYARGGKYLPEPTSLNKLVEETVPLIRHSIGSDISIETDLAKNVFDVEADLTQMQMVLTAVLNNAVEAIDGTGRIRIIVRNENVEEEFAAAHPGIQPGPHVCLTVEDNGRGMDQETLIRIFEPFFTTKFHGRGLGMAAVYGIVRNHNGTVLADSELGKGTAIRIYLPAAKPEMAEMKELQAKAATTATILVIEDEDVVAEICQSMLERLGHRSIIARTGKEAIEIVARFDGTIDLALLDIKLSDMDGGAIYPVIKKERPKTKVIVCSGYSLDDTAQAILDAGADGFLQKPFSLGVLSAKLNEVLTGE